MSSAILLTILVPVYNEQKTVLKILKKVCNLDIDKYEVIVVDDCSRDKSPEIIKNFKSTFKSKKCNLITVRHNKNLGKGSGIKTALKLAKGMYFVVQDADLEYDPYDIPVLFKKAISTKSKVVYGSRFMGHYSGMPKPNYIANKFYNMLIRWLYDTRVTDMHTCYKMIETKLIKSFNMQSSGFEYATELIGNILSRNIEVVEVPISFRGRTKKDGKKIDFYDGLLCIKHILRDYLVFRGYYSNLMRLIKFTIVGVIGFLINFGVISTLNYYGFTNIIFESITATLLAINVTFIFHDKWTYRIDKNEDSLSKSARRRYATYIMSNFLGGIINIVVISVLVGFLGFDRLNALIISALSVLVWNYTVNTLFIWKIASKR